MSAQKGEAGAGYAQYPANAMMLCGRPEFCGPDFSPGDAYIKEMSEQIGETGGPKQSLQAGISHHIAYIVNQLGHLDQTPDHAAASNEAAPDWPASIGSKKAH